MENRKNSNTKECKLIDTLTNNHLDQALEIINFGIDINALIEFQFKNYKPVYQSFLHIMIIFNNTGSLQFLLEQGADPNILNSKGQSTLEILLTELCVKVVNYVEKKGPALSKSDINQAEKIADLLICFGLDHHKIIWTESFLKYTNEIKGDLDISANDRLDHYKLITAINTITEMPNYKKKIWIREKFDFLKRKKDILAVKKDYKKIQIDDEDLESWFHSTSNIVESLEISANKIQLEKKEILVEVSKNINE